MTDKYNSLSHCPVPLERDNGTRRKVREYWGTAGGTIKLNILIGLYLYWDSLGTKRGTDRHNLSHRVLKRTGANGTANFQGKDWER